jgi:hypothetical protein
MNEPSALKHGFVDFAAVLFVIGGVVSFVMNILTIPINSIYPLIIPTNFSLVFLVVLGISVICSLGAIHCYSLTTTRMLSEAGIRGIIFGALLLFFSIGLVGSFRDSNTNTLLTAISAVLIIVAGIICFALRHTNVSASAIAHQHIISQPSYQA